MYKEGENCFYYVTTMNENYVHHAMPEGAEEGIIKGIYKLKAGTTKKKNRVQLMGGGAILREVEAAADILRDDFDVESDIWSLTSVNELARQGQHISRHNTLHPEDSPKKAYITECLEDAEGPVIAATDYMKAYAEQLRAFIPGPSYTVLGTDGFGRSDTRSKLRHFFEVNRHFIVVAALKALADEGVIKPAVVSKAIKDFGLDATKPDPMTL
jgi:pyruvate dehydrogenase E1 component